MPPRSPKAPHVAFALYLVLCAAALVWPVFRWAGDRTEPRVLGLPPAFAWSVGWVFLTFAALALYHRATGGGDDAA